MFTQTLQYIEGSTFFAGVMMLVLNIGSRYITHEYSDNDEEYQQNILLRRFAIFAACFVGTRSVVTSILLTAGFVIIATGLFRGKSTYAKEGMKNPDMAMRAAAGLSGQVDAPAYDHKIPTLF
jgi:hypothetical protein